MLIKLVVFDLDQTLWNYDNASDLRLPLQNIGPDSLKDSKDSVVTLFKGVRDLLMGLKAKNIRMSVASWNDPPPVTEVLKLLNIKDYFEYPQIEWDRPKAEMIRTIVTHLKRDGVSIRSDEILFVDDSNDHLDAVQKADSQIRRAKAWSHPIHPEALLQATWLG